MDGRQGADAAPPVLVEMPGADGSLAEFRASTGLTAADVARQLRVSRPTVSRWEAGTHRPAAVYLTELATLLGVGPTVLERALGRHPVGRCGAVRLPGLGRLRRGRGLRARDVAAALGVAASTVSSWETGAARVPTERLAPLAALLGVAPSELIGWATASPPRSDSMTVWAAGRLFRRMTQREAAAVLGVSISQLSRVENGHRRPAPSLATAMVRVYGLKARSPR
jgi:transcriptional regulator with XRE-family HTH domain